MVVLRFEPVLPTNNHCTLNLLFMFIDDIPHLLHVFQLVAGFIATMGLIMEFTVSLGLVVRDRGGHSKPAFSRSGRSMVDFIVSDFVVQEPLEEACLTPGLDSSISAQRFSKMESFVWNTSSEAQSTRPSENTSPCWTQNRSCSISFAACCGKLCSCNRCLMFRRK